MAVIKSLPLFLVFAILTGLIAGCAAALPDQEPTRGTTLADPAVELDASSSRIEQVDLYSPSLDRQMGFTVYLPPDYSPEQPYPVLYLFYGYGGNRDSWFYGLNIHRVADQMIEEGRIAPLIMVSPSYGNSFAVNSTPGEGRDPGTVDIGSYEDYLIQEVIPYVDSRYNTVSEQAGRYVGGASMGGYAALYLGLTYPELFSKIGAHSAAVWDYSPTDLYLDQRDWLYASEELRAARDPFLLAASEQLKDRGIKVYLDAGDSDPLSEKDKHLYEVLLEHQVDAKWTPNPGGHNGTYWASQLENYLLFYNSEALPSS
jgi:enterochelin esterase-like enzyme